jgi:hypothetical protein
VSAIENVSGLTPNNCSITFPIGSTPFLRPRFLQSAATDQIQIKLVFYDLDNLQGTLIDTYIVESFQLNTNSVELNCLSIESLLESRSLNMLYSFNCNYQYGGKFCGVNRNNFAISYLANAFTIINPYQISILTANAPPNFDLYANNGTIILQLNAEYGSLPYECPYRTFIDRAGTLNSIIDLYNPVYLIPADYTGLTVQAGCSKTITNCTSFGNQARYGGYPRISGKNVSLAMPVKS